MTVVAEEQVGLQRPRISIVFPARNEAQNPAHVLPYIPSIVSKVTLVDGRAFNMPHPFTSNLFISNR